MAQNPITDGPAWKVVNITGHNTLKNPNTIHYGPDDHLWITERSGKRVLKVNPESGAVSVMLDLSSSVYQEPPGGGQDGLLGFAIHPDLYQDIRTPINNYVYLAYTYLPDKQKKNRHLRIERYQYNNKTGVLDGNSATAIIEGLPASGDHNSGKLVIGPELKLYYSIGDQGHNQFQQACLEIRSQQLPTKDDLDSRRYSSYQGKILRLNLDGSIPSDNPILENVQSHIYSYGHRNAQGIVFGSNGILYSSEHGPKTDDEINLIRAGKNYGWPQVSGYQDGHSFYTYCNWSSAPSCVSSGKTNTDHDCLDDASTISEVDPSNPRTTEPIKTWGTLSEKKHPADALAGNWLSWPSVAPAGIEIYELDSIPGWSASLLVPTLKKGVIYRAKLSDDGLSIDGDFERFHSSNDRYRDIVVDPDGTTIYAVTDNSGGTSGPSGTGGPLENPGLVMKIQYINTAPANIND